MIILMLIQINLLMLILDIRACTQNFGGGGGLLPLRIWTFPLSNIFCRENRKGLKGNIYMLG